MYKNIIFLDIDGVLTDDTCRGVSPDKIKILNNLYQFNVGVVISSTWGYNNGRTKEKLNAAGLLLPIIGYTKHFHNECMCRGNEIEDWLNETFPHRMGTKWGDKYAADRPYNYAILDDDEDFLLGQRDHFVHVDNNIGLTEDDIKKVITIITAQYE